MNQYRVVFLHRLYQDVVNWFEKLNLIPEDQRKLIAYQYGGVGFSNYKIDDVRKELIVMANSSDEAKVIGNEIFFEVFMDCWWKTCVPVKLTCWQEGVRYERIDS